MKQADGRPFAHNSFASPAIRHVTKECSCKKSTGSSGVATVERHLNPDRLWDLAAEGAERARRVLSWKT